MIGYSRAFNELYGPKPIEGKSKMNERINQLAEQATQKFSRFGERDSWEKLFAELIVRECAKQVDNYWDAFENGYADKQILKHFGVEE